VEVKSGAGKIKSPHEVEIVETGEVIWGRHIVIATGSRASVPPIPGLAEADYWTNETVFEATELPKRLVVIGGGPIGLEIGQTFRRLGSEVTVVHDLAHVAPKEDADVAEVLAKQLRAEGIVIHDKIKIAGIDVKAGESQVTIEGSDGTQTLTADQIFLATGRRAKVEGLGLDEVGVAYDRGITVDDTCRTSMPSIRAIGDVASPYQFTHCAGYQAKVVIRNVLFRLTSKCDYSTIPWVRR
jgi:pyruvate/2-oxoglutarate dehydrogenase complex dihydrolipoamide dehydrogenase (E3) component